MYSPVNDPPYSPQSENWQAVCQCYGKRTQTFRRIALKAYRWFRKAVALPTLTGFKCFHSVLY